MDSDHHDVVDPPCKMASAYVLANATYGGDFAVDVTSYDGRYERLATHECNGAPVYQHGGADGPVLSRVGIGSSTYWHVADSSALDTCSGDSYYLGSAFNAQPGGGPPNAAAYGTGDNGESGGTGWIDEDASPRCTSGCGIAVVAAGGH